MSGFRDNLNVFVVDDRNQPVAGAIVDVSIGETPIVRATTSGHANQPVQLRLPLGVPAVDLRVTYRGREYTHRVAPSIGNFTVIVGPSPSASASEPVSGRRTLTGAQSYALSEALLSAYRSYSSLEQMMYFGLEMSLPLIAPNGPLGTVVFEIIKWAEDTDKVDLLVEKARTFNDSNEALRLFQDALISSRGEAAPTRVSIPLRAVEKLSEPSRLERIVFSHMTHFQDPEPWRKEMERVEAAVCQICVDDRPLATGFLVGPDAVMTANHALESLAAGPESAARITVRFDDETYRLADRWTIEQSPTDQLDYVLVRLAKAAGSDRRSAASDLSRGWIVPGPRPLQVGESVFILQHPLGGRLKFSNGSVKEEGETRIVYTVNTEPGSSGAPCFTLNWELVALHHRWEEAGNVGVPISAIVAASQFFREPPAPAVVQPSRARPARRRVESRGKIFAMKAEFMTDKKGPIWESSANGWKLRIGLVAPPTNPSARVTYQLRHFYDEGRHKTITSTWKDGFIADFTSYGDLPIVVTLKQNSHVKRCQSLLSASLRQTYAEHMTAAIEKALKDLEAN